MREYLHRYEVRYSPARHSVLNALIDAYQQWIGRREAPRIAILDWKEVPSYSEFVMFAEYFRSQGIECVIADPREVEYRNGRLMAGDFHITLIYKRVLISEWSNAVDSITYRTGSTRWQGMYGQSISLQNLAQKGQPRCSERRAQRRAFSMSKSWPPSMRTFPGPIASRNAMLAIADSLLTSSRTFLSTGSNLCSNRTMNTVGRALYSGWSVMPEPSGGRRSRSRYLSRISCRSG